MEAEMWITSSMKKAQENRQTMKASELIKKYLMDRHPESSTDGALVTCITVPRFFYEGFEIMKKEEMLARYPESSGFWNP